MNHYVDQYNRDYRLVERTPFSSQIMACETYPAPSKWPFTFEQLRLREARQAISAYNAKVARRRAALGNTAF
jgi:hypothetical protein